MAALSVHRAGSGMCTLAPRLLRRRRSSPFAATPPRQGGGAPWNPQPGPPRGLADPPPRRVVERAAEPLEAVLLAYVREQGVPAARDQAHERRIEGLVAAIGAAHEEVRGHVSL